MGKGNRVGLVPTMGYLHDGHRALMDCSVRQADKTVLSLFVNPTQFGPAEDLDVYPRDFEGDSEKARRAGVDLLFCPGTEEIYLPDHQTQITVLQLSAGLCGQDRPGHFAGVATVVAKLLNIVRPDQAYFGEKDFQQLRVIQQLVKDLNFDTVIHGVPIVREQDGLAMSSRNAYLSAEERTEALVLYRALRVLREYSLSGRFDGNSDRLINAAAKMIESSPLCTVEYLTIVDEQSLEPRPVIAG
ncbi:MAG: pantoate--beta-alanine ligase, partial [Desulfofustis sp.]